MNTRGSSIESLRVDKWLWAARFFKTRSLASEAVTGGKVHVNGQRIKPARPVRIGDRLRIQRGSFEYTVDIIGLSDQRRPAKEACLLYNETDESAERREALVNRIRLDKLAHGGYAAGRPDKRQRRHIVQFRRERDQNSE